MKVRCVAVVWLGSSVLVPKATTGAEPAPEIRTPKTSPSPRINGSAIFGARPGSPFLYHVPATGDRPMGFFASDLPSGLRLDTRTGEITGTVNKAGEYPV